jgi:hypothetical protein
VRNHGKDDNVMLHSPRTLTVETAMEWIDRDELVEVHAPPRRGLSVVSACASASLERRGLYDGAAVGAGRGRQGAGAGARVGLGGRTIAG